MANLFQLGAIPLTAFSVSIHLRNPSLFNNYFIDSLPISPLFYPSSSYQFLSFSHYTAETFSFKSVIVSDLFTIIAYKTSPSLVFLTFPVLCSCFIFSNMSILSFIFSITLYPLVLSLSWKQSVVILFPKHRNPSSFFLFRFISIPPFLSKLLERICFRQLNEFFRNIKAIPECQSGFRSQCSITTELLHLSDAVLHDFDSRSLLFNIVIIVALDFSKTFNTVNRFVSCQALFPWFIFFRPILNEFFPHKLFPESPAV